MALSVWGTVDGFDQPNILRGFVVVRDSDGNLLDGTEIRVFVDDRPLVTTRVTENRPDVCGGHDHPAGWRVAVDQATMLFALSTRKLRVEAVHPDLEGGVRLGIWDLIERRARDGLCSSLVAEGTPELASILLKQLSMSSNINPQTQALLARCATVIPRLERSDSTVSGVLEERTEVSVPVGLQSSDGSCVLGRNGTVFLTEGTNAILSRYTTAEAQLTHLSDAWVALFEARAAQCLSRNIFFLQLVIPEKLSLLHTLYPEHLDVPTRLLSGIEERCQADTYLSANDALQDWVPEAYFRTDSHLSPKGAWGVVTAIFQKLGLPLDEVDFSASRSYSGDLASQIFGTPLVETAAWPSGWIDNIEPSLIEDDIPVKGNTGRRMVWKAEAAPNRLRVVAFANSYFERGAAPFNISWWFARLFSEFHFVWGGYCDFSYIDDVKPDIVICQTVERFLFVTPPQT